MTQLSRRMSPFTLFLLSVNGIVGSGWLFAPFFAAKIAGSAALISWLIGGFAAILISLTFAELSAMLPVAGGTAHIPQVSHGTLVSFAMSWISWVISLLLAPIEVLAVLQYASLFYPSLIHAVSGTPVLSGVGYIWAAILMLGLSALNIISYNGLVRFNFILCIFKFGIMFLTIGLIIKSRFIVENFAGIGTTMMSTSGWHAIFSAVATGGIVLAFNGFKSGVELAGEAKNISLAVPLSTAGAVLACLLIYLGLQISFIGAMDPQAINNGWGNLTFTGDVGPFVGLTIGLGLVFLLKLLYTNAIVSPLGAGLIYVTTTARILYAMSKIGYVPKFLCGLNKHHFPIWAIIVNFALGMLAFLPLPGWQAMMNFLVSAVVITYAMGPIALVCLRLSMPEKKRPFKLPAANFLCLLAFYCCNLFSYWTGWQTMSKLTVALMIGAAIFAVSYTRGVVKLGKNDLRSIFWILPYMLGLILISYLGSFGGVELIPFGWDFLVIGLFSISIFSIAIYTRIKEDVDETSLVHLADNTLVFDHQ